MFKWTVWYGTSQELLGWSNAWSVNPAHSYVMKAKLHFFMVRKIWSVDMKFSIRLRTFNFVFLKVLSMLLCQCFKEIIGYSIIKSLIVFWATVLLFHATWPSTHSTHPVSASQDCDYRWVPTCKAVNIKLHKWNLKFVKEWKHLLNIGTNGIK